MPDRCASPALDQERLGAVLGPLATGDDCEKVFGVFRKAERPVVDAHEVQPAQR